MKKKPEDPHHYTPFDIAELQQAYNRTREEEMVYEQILGKALTRLQDSPVEAVRVGSVITQFLLSTTEGSLHHLDLIVDTESKKPPTATDILVKEKYKLPLGLDSGIDAMSLYTKQTSSVTSLTGYVSKLTPLRKSLTIYNYALTESNMGERLRDNAADILESSLAFTVVDAYNLFGHRFDSHHPYLQKRAVPILLATNAQREHLDGLERQGRQVSVYEKDPRKLSDEEVIEERLGTAAIDSECSVVDLVTVAQQFYDEQPSLSQYQLGKLMDIISAYPRESTLFEFFFIKTFQPISVRTSMQLHIARTERNSILHQYFMAMNDQENLKILEEKQFMPPSPTDAIVYQVAERQLKELSPIQKAQLAAEYILKRKLLELPEKYF